MTKAKEDRGRGGEEEISSSSLSPLPEELWRYRYRYKSRDGRYYILVHYEIDLDGISRAFWC